MIIRNNFVQYNIETSKMFRLGTHYVTSHSNVIGYWQI